MSLIVDSAPHSEFRAAQKPLGRSGSHRCHRRGALLFDNSTLHTSAQSHHIKLLKLCYADIIRFKASVLRNKAAFGPDLTLIRLRR